MNEARLPAWLYALSEQELDFLKDFVCNSGSLKAIAKIYDLSYPTVRLRLDRLIQKLLQAEKDESQEFKELLKDLTFAGKLPAEDAHKLLSIYERDCE